MQPQARQDAQHPVIWHGELRTNTLIHCLLLSAFVDLKSLHLVSVITSIIQKCISWDSLMTWPSSQQY